jgi:hypothetical protein
MDSRTAQPKLRPIIAAAALLGLALTFASWPAAAQQWTPQQRAACDRTRCGSANSTSRTLAVSGRACPITVATSVPPAVLCSRAVRRRRQDALGKRRIGIALSPESATSRPSRWEGLAAVLLRVLAGGRAKGPGGRRCGRVQPPGVGVGVRHDVRGLPARLRGPVIHG